MVGAGAAGKRNGCDQARLVREKERCEYFQKHGNVISRVRNPPGQVCFRAPVCTH
jgi:hypothetical protein